MADGCANYQQAGVTVFRVAVRARGRSLCVSDREHREKRDYAQHGEKKKQEKSAIAEHFDVTVLARKIRTRICPFGTDPLPVQSVDLSIGQIPAYILIAPCCIICKFAIVIAIVKMQV